MMTTVTLLLKHALYWTPFAMQQDAHMDRWVQFRLPFLRFSVTFGFGTTQKTIGRIITLSVIL